MNHPVAQFVALTCHANAFLRGRPVPPFFPDNSTCGFCDWVRFVHVSRTLLGKVREQEVAATPDLWFVHLKGTGASSIRLSCRAQNHPKISDRMSAGLVSGGRTWAMEAVRRDGKPSTWLSRWEVWDQNAPERRIWRVSYGRVSQTRPRTQAVADLDAAAKRFRSALGDILEFSERQECGVFAACFARAIETLDSGGTKRYGYHKDLAPDGSLPPFAVSLLDACQSAWVFGGMGSWNDLAFQGDVQAEYEWTSEWLFLALNEVIPAAANASSIAAG